MKNFNTEAEAIASQSKEIEITEIKGVPYAKIPHGHTLESLEKLLPNPTRIRAQPLLLDVEAFGEYFKEFQQDGTRIFVDDRDFTFTSVFDSDTPDLAGHGDHKATLQFFKSHEWSGFRAISRDYVSRDKMARFLEQNIDYITGEFSGVRLLDMTRKLTMKIRGDIDINEDLANGVRGLVVSGNTTVKAKEGDNYIPFPEKIDINVRIFKHCPAYKLEARFHWKLQNDDILLALDLIDPDGVEESAFNQVIESVEKETGKKPIRGHQ